MAAPGITPTQIGISFQMGLLSTQLQANAPLSYPSLTDSFNTGTGNNQVDEIYAGVNMVLAASANLDINFGASATILDALGNPVVLTKLKALFVYAYPANTNNVIVAPSGSNGFVGFLAGTTPTITLPPGGKFYISAPVGGWTVDATHKSLNFLNSAAGTSVAFDCIFIGV